MKDAEPQQHHYLDKWEDDDEAGADPPSTNESERHHIGDDSVAVPPGMYPPQWHEATEPAAEEWPYGSAGANAWWQQDPLTNKDLWKQDAYENGYKHWSYDGGGYNAG